MPLALVPNLAKCNVCGSTCISSKFDQQVAPLALVPTSNAICIGSNFGHQVVLLAWPPDGATCISCKIGHQMALIGLKFGHQLCVTCIGSKVGNQVVSHTLPHCLGMLYLHDQLVLSLYIHQPESHQLSLQQGNSV